MPWKRTDPMEERLRFVMEAESDVFEMDELCQRYGVSRKTGYKWLQRYRQEGVAGLQDRSRAPLKCPHRTPEAIADVLIEGRRRHPHWGAEKVVEKLSQLASATRRGGSPRGSYGRLQGRISDPGSTLLLSADDRRPGQPLSAGLSSLLLHRWKAGRAGLSGDFPGVWAPPGHFNG